MASDRDTLELTSVRVRYGTLVAVDGLSMKLKRGEITLLTGHNGAGKTSSLMTIAGLVPLDAGSISVAGRDFNHVAPGGLYPLGVSVVPAGHSIFPNLSVEQHLDLAERTAPSSVAGSVDWILSILPDLSKRLGTSAGSLSGGERQQLSIALSLGSRPKFLVLDEPSAGISPVIVGHIARLLSELREQGTGVLIAEQNLGAFLDRADRTLIMKKGRVVHESAASDVDSESIWALF